MNAQEFTIQDTLGKMKQVLGDHKEILVSISGGSDEFIYRLQLHDFDFKNDGLKDFETLYVKYPKSKGALQRWCQVNKSINVSNKAKYWLINNADKIPKVSNKCCDYAKKDVSKAYIKANPNITCVVTGMRQSEGGMRLVSMQQTGCYFTSKWGYHMYHPLSLWDDETKAHYKKTRGIRNSDCYDVWGMKRTGCVGCPYARHFKEEIEVINKYEPKLAKAVNNLFGASYAIKDEINSESNTKLAKQTLGKKEK